jgi:uncharacterized membrane protein YedE/YeeE
VNRTVVLLGGVFGFVIVASRLNTYQVIHDMLLLREPDVFLLMASAIAVAAPILLSLRRRRWHTPLGGEINVPRSPVTRKNVAGAAVFGTGWAVAGTCPIPALAMAAEGSAAGVFVMAGLFAGIAVRDRLARSTPAEVCGEVVTVASHDEGARARPTLGAAPGS